jgi:hypothetical protein
MLRVLFIVGLFITVGTIRAEGVERLAVMKVTASPIFITWD